MGNEHHDMGLDLKVFFVPESSLLTPQLPVTTHGFNALSATIGRPTNYAWVRDKRNTRSRLVRKQLRQPVCPWTIKTYMRPSGAAGTAPDIGDILTHLCGTEVIVGSTSATYTPLKDMSHLSASIYVGRSEKMEGLYGCIVQKGKLAIGDEYWEWEFSGIGTNYFTAGYALTNGTGEGITTLVVASGFGKQFTKYGLISIDGDDNSSAGYQITAIAGDSLTIAPAATWGTGDVVEHFLPVPAVAGEPFLDTDGTLSLDDGSTDINFVGFSMELESGADLLNVEKGKVEASDVVNPNWRMATINADFLAKRENSDLVQSFRTQTAQELLVTIGTAAGSILNIDMGNLELDAGDEDSPEEDMGRWSATGPGLGTSGEDEYSLIFT